MSTSFPKRPSEPANVASSPDQLVLEDDPAFVPDMVLPGLDIDLAALDIATDASSRRSSILSPHSQRTSLSSQHTTDESALGLVIPSSDGGGAVDMGGFIIPSSEHASIRGSAGMGGLLGEVEDDFNLDPGFMFDNDGNMIDTGEVAPPLQDRPAASAAGRVRADSGASSHVRRELQEGVQAGQAEVSSRSICIGMSLIVSSFGISWIWTLTFLERTMRISSFRKLRPFLQWDMTP